MIIKKLKLDEVSQNLTKQVVMIQNYAWMILDELYESQGKLWVFKGEFFMDFLSSVSLLSLGFLEVKELTLETEKMVYL